jgi:hypothetical protein
MFHPKELFENLPDITSSPVIMDEPNAVISIHKGSFQLVHEGTTILIDGKIWFDWFPSTRVKFAGDASGNSPKEIESLFLKDGPWQLIIADLTFGKCSISKTLNSDSVTVEGTMTTRSVYKDRSIPVTKLRFAIPNLRELNGLTTKAETDYGYQTSNSRTEFVYNDYTIIIDQHPNFKDLNNSLKAKGGYLILYSGELTSKKGVIKYDEIKEVFKCFSNFLSFVNGRRCSPLFIQGVFENKEVWIDYTPYSVAQFKQVISWPQHFHSTKGFGKLWQNFCDIWSDEGDRDFLTNLIHWYTEVNSNTDFFAGSIVMTQAALELLYNWYVIEEKKMILGKDGENLSAANKIRILISNLKISYEIPKAFHELNLATFKAESAINDAPEIFVQIRNAIIHSQERKRNMLAKLSENVKFQALQLGLWYIELSLLYILKFDDKYFNRCSGIKWLGEGEDIVPWIEGSLK